MSQKIPVIDLFAGPGGLSEGFASIGSHKRPPPIHFDVRLSIENDPVAIETLKLRKFFRSFRPGDVPQSYYRYIRREGNRDPLESLPEWLQAERSVAALTLGLPDHQREIHRLIRESVGGDGNFVLIGGPPCQAYSLVGRSRMTGLGQAGVTQSQNDDTSQLKRMQQQRLDAFYADGRHTLYRAYLEILALHTPMIFVMENVKGILSSKLRKSDGETESTFARVLTDLESPHESLKRDERFQKLMAEFPCASPKYRLYSLSPSPELNLSSDLFDQSAAIDPRRFLIRAEQHGIPQKRHRIIVVGVRDDIPHSPIPLELRGAPSVRDAIGDLPPLRSRISPRRDDSTVDWINAVSQEARSIGRALRTQHRHLTGQFRALAQRQASSLPVGAPYMATQTSKAARQTNQFREWVTDRRLGGVIQHEARSHMISDLGRYLFASVVAESGSATGGRSPTLEAWPEHLLPRHSNVINGRENLTELAFKDRFRVQVAGEPATTITSHISKDGHYFIHYSPRQCRSLTVREAARLQTFPDNYFFEGNRTEQYRQVGNAVPPLLAYSIAQSIADMIREVQAATKVQPSDAA